MSHMQEYLYLLNICDVFIYKGNNLHCTIYRMAQYIGHLYMSIYPSC